jgi:ubiquinone/menaquinone biosynthesis C-methylase UbiE
MSLSSKASSHFSFCSTNAEKLHVEDNSYKLLTSVKSVNWPPFEEMMIAGFGNHI